MVKRCLRILILQASSERLIINNIDTVSLGNIFVILFAGHETSANTLAIALAALAVHPDAQERFRAEVYEHSTNERMPVRMDLMCIHSSH
jgi:hypothetical protein